MDTCPYIRTYAHANTHVYTPKHTHMHIITHKARKSKSNMHVFQSNVVIRWLTTCLFAFDTRESFRYLAAHGIAARVGPKKAHALLICHDLTGCDTASSFAGHGKKTAWTIWTVLREHTEALRNLSSAPSVIPDDVMHTLEMVVTLLYDRTITCRENDKARKKFFAKKNNVH